MLIPFSFPPHSHTHTHTTHTYTNSHRFAFLAKKGLRFLQHKFPDMILEVAFLIESRAEEELPEQLLGVCRLNHPDYEKAAEGVFEGLRKEEREG